jgi:hypothetical protein
MPEYKFHGRLLYFSVFKNHFSLFGATHDDVRSTFKKELSRYEGTGKAPSDSLSMNPFP